MILAVDMGNSNIVVGGLDDQATYFEERITTDDRKTSLEYAIMLKNILEIQNKTKRHRGLHHLFRCTALKRSSFLGRKKDHRKTAFFSGLRHEDRLKH